MPSLALQKLLQQSDLDRDQSNQVQNKFIMNHLGIPPSGPLGLMAIKPRRKVFVSYHHAPLDQIYRDEFEKMFARLNGVFISKSVQIGDINPNLTVETIRSKIRDEYLRDSTVTVVLIGPNTWQRKHVDWEISSSIRQTALSSRSGLLGILLPNHPNFGQQNYDQGIVPPRLANNAACGFASIYNWSTDASFISNWIEIAFNARDKIAPDNSFPHFVNNKSSDRWC